MCVLARCELGVSNQRGNMGKERVTRKDELEGIGGESEEGTGE